jgi:uncharacterized protein
MPSRPQRSHAELGLLARVARLLSRHPLTVGDMAFVATLLLGVRRPRLTCVEHGTVKNLEVGKERLKSVSGPAVGQFLLTGSSSPADDARRHSGAGRIATVRMRPMTLYESVRPPARSRWRSCSLATIRRPHPAAAICARFSTCSSPADGRSNCGALTRGSSSTTSTRPCTSTSAPLLTPKVGSSRAAAIRTRCCAVSGRWPATSRPGTTASGRSIAADAGLSREAVTDYLDALQQLMILEEQPAFNVHLRSSRNLRTTPHRHLADPSLATAALQVAADGLLRDLDYTGLLFESLVVRDLRELSQPLDASVSYFHTDHHKIDIVIQRPDGTGAQSRSNSEARNRSSRAPRHYSPRCPRSTSNAPALQPP